jgi:hypothetical protein
MGIDNNDDIAKMLGGKTREASKETGYSKYKKKEPIIIDVEEVKFNAESTKGVGDNLKNVPPLIILGIVAIVGAGFTPYKWLYTVGFCLIIIAVFDKVIPAEKKIMMKDKIKGWFKKKQV